MIAVICGITYADFRNRAQRERDFVEFVLIRERGAYTLFGSKPVSEFTLEYSSSKRKLTASEIKDIEIQRQHRRKYFHRRLSDLWVHWKKNHPVDSEKFCLLEVSLGERDSLLALINKQRLKSALKMHYDDFKELMEREFDVEVMVNNQQLLKDLLHRSLKSHLAMGILFGYGYENAKKYHAQPSASEKVRSSVDIMDYIKTRMQKHVSLSDLVIPTFACFSKPDPQVIQYEKERKEIIEKYRGKDLRRVFIEVFEGKG